MSEVTRMHRHTESPMSSLSPEFRIDEAANAWQPAVNARFLSLLGGYVDQLICAADRRDWTTVGRLGVALAEGSNEAGAFEVSGAAQQVAAASRSANNPANIRRALLRLIGACGRARRAPTAGCTA